MLLRNKFNGFLADGTRTPFFSGGGGGGGTTQSTGTTYTTNLPEYAQPYVETMLGATQKQLFQTQPGPGVYDPNTGQTSAGTTEITGFQPYTPYSTDPSKSVAGFSPLQQQAQQTVAGMQTPGAYGQAQGLAGMAGMGQFGTAQQAGALGQLGMLGASAAAPAFGAGQQYMQGITDPATMGAYMSPYQQNVTDIAKMNAVRESQIAGNQANLGAARQGTYGGARQALMGAEREKNLLSNLSNIQAQGSQSAYDRALAQQQFGANLGLQGITTGLQGISTGMQGIGQGIGAQQAGYAGAGQAASTMGSLAGQEFGTQKDIIGLQQQAGAQQQQQQQQIVNQAIQDYANAQQYPMMQLGFMSNMLRGLPMQSTNTQQYVAAPNQLTQGIGALGAGANIYSAFSGNPTRVAEGGQIKSYAKGGIASYDVGGNVESDLYKIKTASELKEIAKNTTSDIIRKDALRIAKMRELGLAGGGIVAFREGKKVQGVEPDGIKDTSFESLPAVTANEGLGSTIANFLSSSDRRIGPDGKVVTKDTYVDPRFTETNPAFVEAKAQRDSILAALPKKDGVKQDVKKEILAPLTATEADKSDKAPASAAPVVVKEDEAAPSGIKAVQPPAGGTTASGDRIPGLSPTMQALYDKSMSKQQTIDEIMAEKKAAIDKYVGPDTRPEERARLMAEKVDLKAERERQKSLELAQFFASWGSTPGSTLQAAMVAVNKHIPTIIASDKEARKAQNEVDKIIRELNKAERLEKEGDVEGAFKIKSEQSKNYKELNKTLMTYQGQKESAQVKATSSDKVTQQKMLLTAQTQLGTARRALTDLASKNKELYEAANMPVLEKESKILTDKRNAAKATIAKLEGEQQAQIDDAENTLKALRQHGDIVVPGGEKKTDRKVINLDNV